MRNTVEGVSFAAAAVASPCQQRWGYNARYPSSTTLACGHVRRSGAWGLQRMAGGEGGPDCAAQSPESSHEMPCTDAAPRSEEPRDATAQGLRSPSSRGRSAGRVRPE